MIVTYKYRYAVIGVFCAVGYCGLLFGLHYLISSETPVQLLRDTPATGITVFLSLPIAFLIGYLWGAEKDQRRKLGYLTERQKQHEEMAEKLSDFMKQGEETRRMAEIAAQEMKHPLTSIVGYTLTLREYWEKLDDESRREFVDFIKVSVSRLEGIVNDLLRITELSKLTPRLEREEVDLVELVAEVRGILEDIYAERELRIGLRFPDEALYLNTDPSRLFDLLYNLLDICMRCSENNEVVSAWCSCDNKRVHIRIRCPHSIIDSEDLEHLKEWPPSDMSGEAATLGMEYRLAAHLVEEIQGEMKLDLLGNKGLSLFLTLPLSRD
ncbi:MAG: HAMP domain-containing sensor histidine kinase [Actinomycetota bacterium]|nr:HAMP domain-containing sensor histidine kinase [Actinomycetota bacterium]